MEKCLPDTKRAQRDSAQKRVERRTASRPRWPSWPRLRDVATRVPSPLQPPSGAPLRPGWSSLLRLNPSKSRCPLCSWSAWAEAGGARGGEEVWRDLGAREEAGKQEGHRREEPAKGSPPGQSDSAKAPEPGAWGEGRDSPALPPPPRCAQQLLGKVWQRSREVPGGWAGSHWPGGWHCAAGDAWPPRVSDRGLWGRTTRGGAGAGGSGAGMDGR